MSDFNITPLSINFFDHFKFNFPKNSTITNVKIHNFNIYTKILPKNKIALYGSYDTTFIFSFKLKNNTYKLIKKNKNTQFFRTFIAKSYNFKNIKISIETLLPPKCFYSINNNNNYMYCLNGNNTCTIYLFSLLAINFTDNNSTQLTPDLSISKNNNNNNLSTFTSSQIYNDKHSKTASNINKNTLSDYYNDQLIVNKKKTKKLIQCNTIIGRGSTNYFINENIIIPSEISPIWSIEKVNASVEVTKLDLIKDKAIISGFITINIVYKVATDNKSKFDYTVCGNLKHIQRILPFSTFINLEAEGNNQICQTDTCQLVNNPCLSEIHTLKCSSTTSFGEIVYNEILEQLSIKIDVLITRTEEIFI